MFCQGETPLFWAVSAEVGKYSPLPSLHFYALRRWSIW